MRWLILILTLIPLYTLQATTVIYHSLPDLTQKADLIVRGQIQSQQTKTSSDGKSPLYTEIQVRVLEVYKTHDQITIGNILPVQNIGGTLHNKTLTVPGAAQFHLGEEVVLFLEQTQEHTWLVLGLAQGKFDVLQDLKTGEKLVRQNLHDLHLIPSPQAHPSTPQTEPPVTMTLTQLKSLIQKYQN